MSNSIDLKQLWNKQTATMPNENEIISKAKKLKRNIYLKLILLIVVFVFTLGFIIYTWLASELIYFTTKIGFSFVVAAIILFITNAVKTIYVSVNTAVVSDSNSFLDHLLKVKKQQEYNQTKLMTKYFIFLTAGLALYMIETTSKMSGFNKIVSITVTFAWIAFNWLYVRPKSIQKEKSKMNDAIKKLQAINKDLTSAE